MPPTDELIARPVTGIQPFNELPVDAEIWREAHEHHHRHRRLHALLAHRPGVVWGFEVIAHPHKAGVVVVAPGAGVDSDGRSVLLGEAVTFTLEERGQIYITAAFLPAHDRSSGVAVGSGQQYFRLVEGRDVIATKEPPTGPYLELARIYRSIAGAAVADARNAFDPVEDELNLLHRRTAFPQCYGDAVVGEMSYVPKGDQAAWKPNRAGLIHLLREGGARGFHLDFGGPVNLRAIAQAASGDGDASAPPRRGGTVGADDPTLLYVAGDDGFQPLAETETDGLRALLDRGSVLWGEATGAAGAANFETAFRDLAATLGASLRPLAKDHPLLAAHHRFATPPSGASDDGRIFADDEAGVFFSTANYGGAWAGIADASPGVAPGNVAPLERERVRAAQEWGMNLIAYSARRRRLRQIARYL